MALGSVLVGLPAAGAAWGLRGDEVGPFLALVAAAAALTAAAAIPAWLLTRARHHLAEVEQNPAPVDGMLGDGQATIQVTAADARARLLHLAGWPQAAIALPAVTAALALVAGIRPSPTPGADDYQLVLGVCAVVFAFPLLVWERRLQTVAREDLPEAAALGRILRLAVWALVAGGLGAVARSFGLEAAVWIQSALGIILGLAAGEALLRALINPFLPAGQVKEARGLGDGAVLALLCTRGAAGDGFAAGIKERFGLDLGRSWAIGFLRRAGPGLLAVLALAAWLLTGLTALGTGERGLYERLGAPVAVFGPGLHAHLPWPFGLVRRTEFGQIHEQPIVLEDVLPPPATTVEEDPSSDWDRMWERTHATDQTYLVASDAAATQRNAGYQLMNTSVRAVWRIGLSDEDARAATYTVADPKAHISALANRLVLSQLAGSSLSSLIGADRDALAARLRDQLALGLRGTGIEINAVVIEAIHPPAKAVPAYHGVQAAEIGAATEVAVAKAKAASLRSDAEREAAIRRDQGAALAVETTSNASAEATRFGADQQAFATAPAAMAIERRNQTLGKALGRAQITVVDHRLQLDGGPVLDLRRTPGPGNE
jgi:regulator of protease activity HflC (stomatin/prohibitin superfamily)